ALAHEPGGAAVEHFEGIEPGRAMHLAAEAQLGIFRGEDDARPGEPQAFQHFGYVVADRGDDPHAGDNYPFHALTALCLTCRCLRYAGTTRRGGPWLRKRACRRLSRSLRQCPA